MEIIVIRNDNDNRETYAISERNAAGGCRDREAGKARANSQSSGPWDSTPVGFFQDPFRK